MPQANQNFFQPHFSYLWSKFCKVVLIGSSEGQRKDRSKERRRDSLKVGRRGVKDRVAGACIPPPDRIFRRGLATGTRTEGSPGNGDCRPPFIILGTNSYAPNLTENQKSHWKSRGHEDRDDG